MKVRVKLLPLAACEKALKLQAFKVNEVKYNFFYSEDIFTENLGLDRQLHNLNLQHVMAAVICQTQLDFLVLLPWKERLSS